MLEELFRKSYQFVQNNNLSYKRYFINNEALEHRLSIIIGARGVGKSVTIAQFMSNYDTLKEALYLSLDDITTTDLNIYELVEEFELKGGKLLCLDEIHKFSNWSGLLKNIYDNFPNLKVIASGSSAMQIHKGAHDLSRRAIIYTMVGMSFKEFLELHHGYELKAYTLEDILQNHIELTKEIVDKLKKQEHKIIALFREYLQHGYYPYFLNMPNETLFFQTLKQNISVTIESDLLNIHPTLNGKSIKKIKQLLAIIMKSVPFTPTMSDLKKSIDVKDDRTIKEYLYHLDNAGLIRLLMKSSLEMKNIDKPQKIYLANTNLMYITSPNIGSVRETFFMNQLYNYAVINHTVAEGVFASKKGDFLVNENYIFEVGGKNKSYAQIKDIKDSFIASDDIEIGFRNKIPLWLFGFLY